MPMDGKHLPVVLLAAARVASPPLVDCSRVERSSYLEQLLYQLVSSPFCQCVISQLGVLSTTDLNFFEKYERLPNANIQWRIIDA